MGIKGMGRATAANTQELTMAEELRNIRLPEELCAKLERQFGSRFTNIEELLRFVMRELSRDEALQMDEAELRLVEQRLKDLGYM